MIEHLSYSSINTFLMCSKRWQLKYIDKHPEETGPNLIFGGAWHKMINLIIEGEKPKVAWSQAFNAKLEEENVTGDWFIEYDVLGQRMIDVPVIQEAIQQLKPLNNESVEKRVELKIPGMPVPLVGYIDMIDEFGPIDFKTTARKWNQSQADQSLQPTIYIASLYQAGLISLPATFRYIIFTKTKNPVVQVLETERTIQDIYNLFDLVSDVWKAINKEAFVANTQGWHCSEKYCGQWNNCQWGGKNESENN